MRYIFASSGLARRWVDSHERKVDSTTNSQRREWRILLVLYVSDMTMETRYIFQSVFVVVVDFRLSPNAGQYVPTERAAF